MSDGDSSLRELVERHAEGELEPDYPAERTPEERVEHVLTNECPRWRGMEWIAAAADTDIEQAQSVVRERLAEGEAEVSGEGVRRNRYLVISNEMITAESICDPNPS
ncbi:hypothetical protein HSBGL_0136 [Halapricum desulfuricans]|uniref:Uncharacterized protein n=1 Tax=Halapricum desulfuricans TaxID=2841257 RepID=A0A897ND06_9EURY|nr:hypothetical protein [Halapricum desulfuricans]QSG10577.1 hypothetical protein HSBGL_0136 [Halapricum desulfuricans]